MTDQTTVLHPDDTGAYALKSVARADIQRIDISDVDLLITTKSGDHFILPGGGISAMGEHPPTIAFSDGVSTTGDLLGEVGAALNLAVEVPMPSSLKVQGAKTGDTGKEQQLAKQVHKLEQQTHEQQQKITEQVAKLQQQQKQIEEQKHQHDDQKQHDQQSVSTLTTDTESTVEQMVQNLQKMEDNLHKSDYDYVEPHRYETEAPPPAAPPGVQPPISLTPIVTLFMGNVVGTTLDTTINAGYNTYYGGGGAIGSDSAADIGPRNALQWSAATITGDNVNDIIYAEGPLVGNANPAVSNSAMYAKEFLLNVAGYFTTLNDITVKGVPTGVSLVGTGIIHNTDGTWTLPSSYVLKQNAFTIVYDTANYTPNGNNTFTLEFDVSGSTTHGSNFSSVQTVQFQYMNVTASSQITDPTLVYDAGGYTKEVYVLPTLDQPNIITAGDGNDIVYGSRSNDTITLGNGADTITDGDGNNTITVGSGFDSITVGNGNNSITAAGGGGTITLGTTGGTGANTITVNSTAGSANSYTINAAGTGKTTINGGDDNYAITTATGVVAINLGAGNDSVTTAGGGGTVSTGSGNQTFRINSAAGSKDAYRLTTAGTGTTGIVGGDDNYTILVGSTGASTVSVGAGTSNITATAGTSLASIATGNGVMTVAAGDGAGDNITVGNSASLADTVTLSVGAGAGDTVTTQGSSASTGTIAIGSGAGDQVHLDSGSYTVTIGGSAGTTNTLALASGSNDAITTGDGNNTLYIGSSTSGTDTITLGNGNNTVFVGNGTNSITAGTGNNILNFTNITSALTIAFGTTGSSTATGANVSDSFTGFGTIYGTNNGDTYTLNTGTLTVYAGSGNDAITLGTGQETVYAGNGNNTIIGTGLTTSTGDVLFGGTGNNIFSNTDAGTTFNGTNGAALTASANNLVESFSNTSATNPFVNVATLPADVTYTYVGGVATVNLNLQTQINELNYASASTLPLNINLAIGAGSGTGGNAAGAIYTFTPTAGYSTIDVVIGNNGGDTLTPSYDDTVLIGGAGADTFQDGNTKTTQTVILVGDNQATGTGTDIFYMGPASEIIVASTHNGSYLAYGWNGSLANASNSAGVVVNLDTTSHTFTNSLFSTALTVAAYSGANWGADAITTTNSYGLNTGTNALSWSTGDFYVPVIGTSTNITAVMGSNYYTNLVYGGTNFVTYYAGGSGSHGNFFYAGSGGSMYEMNGGYGVADVLTAGGTNIYYTYNGAYGGAYNISVILNKALDSGAHAAVDASISTTFGGVTYTGFAWGWGNATTPVNNPLTYISGYENVLGYTGNDYFVGDNLGDQFNAGTGSNTIILGNGTNIVTAIQGSNSISSSSASGQTIGINTLNFETVNDANSGVLATYSSGNNASAEVFLNYTGTSTQTTFFGSGGDETAFYGSSALASAYEAKVGVTGTASYSTVQAGIIATINGSDYSSGVTNTAAAANAASTTVNSTFTVDNVYSGAKSIIGHAGADIFIDNIGTNAESFSGVADTSNIYYMTPTQVADVSITGSSAHLNILRVEGWGATTTSGNAFGTTDPFSTAKITGVTQIDVRSGADTLSGYNVTLGANSATNTNAPTFNLSAADIQNIVGNGNSSTLVLKLDNGDHFTATTVAGITPTDSHNAALYYSDIITYKNSSNVTVATLDIHYGTG